MESVVNWIWAKSAVDDRRVLAQWLPLSIHLADSAAIAERLWDEWLAPPARRVVAAATGDERSGRCLLALLAALHDIGKATPVFQAKVPQLAADLERRGLPLGFMVTAADKRRLPHGLAGQVILARYLLERGWNARAADQLSAVVGGHHGIPPELKEVQAAEDTPLLLGDEGWAEVQRSVIERAVRRSGIDLDALRTRSLGQPAAVVLTGLVIVADWIASNAALFPLAPLGRFPDHDADRVRRAWSRIDLPRPWQAVDEGLGSDETLERRFALSGPGTKARPVQTAALRAARTCELPGLLVIEAPMGEGKTEAAFLAAEVLAARTGAAGCFVALPTQATSNAMFARMLSWLGRVPDASGSYRARHAVALAHGRAALDRTFAQLTLPGRSSGVGSDEPLRDAAGRPVDEPRAIDAYVHWWMTNRKKSPLADFAVGTIDQLLFAALQARHLALRHLGLVGKVVIVDEVHSYDAYMNTYLDRVLEWLGVYRVPVIMLSATLPPALRERLVAAYQAGSAAASPARRSWVAPSWDTPKTEPAARAAADDATPAYPAVTSLAAGEPSVEAVPASSRRLMVTVALTVDDLDELTRLLTSALRDGGCALVVRNTVRRAQAAFEHLSGLFGQESVSLHHSRFLACDRARNDETLRRLFGPPEGDGQAGPGDRPSRHVVVATQVVEQSLDVDFDLLVTDVAPMDLLLQRIGRLHRHQRVRPRPVAQPQCLVVAEDWWSAPPRFDPGSQAVYEPFALLQSAALVRDRVASALPLALPEDIAPLVHAAYAPQPLVPPGWEDVTREAIVRRDRGRADQEQRARAFRLASPRTDGASLNGWLGRSVGEADESADGLAQVRDSEDSIEVIVLARDAGGVRVVPRWIGHDRAGEVVPWESEPDRELAHVIASCAVRLPGQLSRGRRGDDIIDVLSRRDFPASWQRVPELRGQLVLVLDEAPDGVLAGTAAGTRFEYHPRTGLRTSAARTESETP